MINVDCDFADWCIAWFQAIYNTSDAFPLPSVTSRRRIAIHRAILQSLPFPSIAITYRAQCISAYRIYIASQIFVKPAPLLPSITDLPSDRDSLDRALRSTALIHSRALVTAPPYISYIASADQWAITDAISAINPSLIQHIYMKCHPPMVCRQRFL